MNIFTFLQQQQQKKNSDKKMPHLAPIWLNGNFQHFAAIAPNFSKSLLKYLLSLNKQESSWCLRINRINLHNLYA